MVRPQSAAIPRATRAFARWNSPGSVRASSGASASPRSRNAPFPQSSSEGEVAEKWRLPRGDSPLVKHDFGYETEIDLQDGSFDIGFRSGGGSPSIAAFEIVPVE